LAWQDELRQLDEELAAGRISAAEYRSRRDHVVSAAANPGQPASTQQPSQSFPPFQQQPFGGQQPQPGQPPAPGPGESTQLIPPVTGGAPQGAAPNPDATQVVPGGRGNGGGNGGGNAEHTQVVPNANPERTQAVAPNWSSTRPPAAGPAERTQMVRRQPGPGSPPAGFPQQGFPGAGPQQGGPWGPPPQGPEDDGAPPWAAGGDFPPLVPQGGDAWLKQGPEVFDEGKSHTGRIIAIVVAVVVLAGVAFGAYWLFGRNAHAGPPAPPNQTTSTTHKPPPPPDPLAIGKVPGTSTGKTVKDFDDVIALNYLNPAEQAAYQAAQPTKAEGTVNATSNPKGDVIVLNVQASSADLAKTAVTALVAAQVTNHAQPVPGQPAGVQATQLDGTIRAHYYTAKGVIVRIEVTAPDAATALQEFDTVLAAQLKALPADAQ
jgi:hypothetical protein